MPFRRKIYTTMKKALVIDINIWTQLLTAVFYALFFAGLKIDPSQTATEIITALKSQSLPLILAAAINLGTMVWVWIKTWKTDKPNFWAFITSRSWLLSVTNIILPLFATWGLYFGDGDAARLVDYALAGDWKNFIALAVITVIGWIGSIWKKKKAKLINIGDPKALQKRA